MAPEFAEYGLELTKLLVENISLPPEVEAALDKRSSMGIVGDLQAFTQFQAANALGDSAKNGGGAGNLAASGVGMGMGMAMAAQIGQSMQPAAASSAAPPPVPGAVQFFLAIDGKQAGPFDLPTLRQQSAGGQLTSQTLVWKAGMPNWTAAGAVGELAGLFAPPLPPPMVR
jgi:hypothetical protein